MIARVSLILRVGRTGPAGLTSGLSRLPQRSQLLLLVRRQDLINLRHGRASDGRKLAHLAAFGTRELLDLRLIIGLNGRLQRLPRLAQLLADRLRRLPRADWKIDLACVCWAGVRLR